ncbi:phage capsid protein [Streptomyces sp. NPDC017615]|uniref:phage capsid protein n=1 Tax=Streptomyces sp. NPDC017615 TaxID=3365003 RepID=UPI00378B5A1B
MALPADNSPWPPPEWAEHYRRMRLDDAWYTGDPRRLGQAYQQAPPRERRWRLWGRRSTEHRQEQRDPRLHVPLPGDIAATSAALLFADMPSIKVEDEATQKRLDVLLDEGRVQQLLLSAAEQAAALSGVFLRTTWEEDVTSFPILTVMQPDAAMPEFRYGYLRAVSFWQELATGRSDIVFRHIERHERGRIVHVLYQGTADNVGRQVPLTEHPDTADLVTMLSSDGQSIPTGIKELTASYVPNLLPNRLHRTAPVGRSDYAAPLYDMFDSLDTVWTSWMRDIRLARARLIVPEQYLRDNGPGQGASFEDEREVYAALKIPPNEAGSTITLAQFGIRVAEHQASAEAIVRQAAQSAGYSAQSFGLEAKGGPITATESDSRDQRSLVTRSQKAGLWRHGIAEQLHVQLLLDQTLFGSQIRPERPNIEFGTGVAESMQSKATTLELLSRAGAVSTATKVKILHPEWDDTDARAEVTAILAETGAAAPDPVGTFPLAA